MTQEEKELLLKDLCARLRYGVKLDFYSKATGQHYVSTLLGIEPDGDKPIIAKVNDGAYTLGQDHIKPYLRPMSSMTKEEERELQSFYPGSFGNQWLDTEEGTIDIFECSSTITLYLNDSERIVDWLNKKMFDYRGLIPMGLALEAPEGMYNTK